MLELLKIYPVAEGVQGSSPFIKHVDKQEFMQAL